MAAAKCPSCKKAVLGRAENPEFPFCSARCRAVDLGKWLGEEYRVGTQSSDEEDDAMSGGESPGGSDGDGRVRH